MSQPTYYSQINQDANILSFYNYKPDGFFVDIGAYDGIALSNTYVLESSYNWKGICVEPIPAQFNKLVMNRPNSFCCPNAVYNCSGKTLDFDVAHDGMLSGISSHILHHKTAVDENKTTIQIVSITLNDLLEKYNAPDFIEYLSLDTEGSELEILQSVDMSKYIFGWIDVEHNYEEPKRSQIRDFLVSNGYVFVRENRHDDCYKHFSL
jgi:FkbM family methyltransferase